MFDGDLGTTTMLLRNVINANVGFVQLGSRVGMPEKSLIRMFGPGGDPRAKSLIAAVAALKESARLSLTVHVAPPRALGHATQ
jgi:DNA-binding phage protein